MTEFRISAELVLQLEDEAAAREFAKGHYIAFLDEELLGGSPLADDASGALAEERVDVLLANPKALATGVLVGLLREGLQRAPSSVDVTHLKLESSG